MKIGTVVEGPTDRAVAHRVAEEWDGVCRVCSQARLFNREIIERMGNQHASE